MVLFNETFDVAAVLRRSRRRQASHCAEPERARGALCERRRRHPRRLGQVPESLFNLVSNAAKFTTQGTVVVEAERQRAGSTDRIVVRVRDTGIGMTDEQLGRIFRAFSRPTSPLPESSAGPVSAWRSPRASSN